MGDVSHIPRLPFLTIASATNNFSRLVGSGATGDVFRGELDGSVVAVKRLKLRAGADRPELERRFRSELDVLSRYAHTRIVRLIAFGVEGGHTSEYPFALVFEFLDGGSLGDWLCNDDGTLPVRKLEGGVPLGALQRVDIALGAASGLAFLHGLREQGDDADAPVGSILHRDVKSANIGLAIGPGGALFAKLLDCGLAKAVRGDVAAAAENAATFTGGVVAGTVGYMAPEVANGVYTTLSEVYSMGVLLLELLMGTRVGALTASAVIDEAEDAGGATPLAARAGGSSMWSPDVAIAMASLVLACLQRRPSHRPQSMAAVIVRLRAIRAAIDVAAPPPVPCPVCLEDVPEASILRCRAVSSADRHVCCVACFQRHVVTTCVAPAVLIAHDGDIPCIECSVADPRACPSLPWAALDLDTVLDRDTRLAHWAAIKSVIRAPREKAAAMAALAAAEKAAAVIGLARSERVRQLRNIIADADLTLKCPRCPARFNDYVGCNALRCATCGCGFCGICLADCGQDAHEHYRSTHCTNYFDRPLFERTHQDARSTRVVDRLRGLAPDAVLQRELASALSGDLRDLGIDVDVLLRRAQTNDDAAEVTAVVATGVGATQRRVGAAAPPPQPQLRRLQQPVVHRRRAEGAHNRCCCCRCRCNFAAVLVVLLILAGAAAVWWVVATGSGMWSMEATAALNMGLSYAVIALVCYLVLGLPTLAAIVGVAVVFKAWFFIYPLMLAGVVFINNVVTPVSSFVYRGLSIVLPLLWQVVSFSGEVLYSTCLSISMLCKAVAKMVSLAVGVFTQYTPIVMVHLWHAMSFTGALLYGVVQGFVKLAIDIFHLFV